MGALFTSYTAIVTDSVSGKVRTSGVRIPFFDGTTTLSGSSSLCGEYYANITVSVQDNFDARKGPVLLATSSVSSVTIVITWNIALVFGSSEGTFSVGQS